MTRGLRGKRAEREREREGGRRVMRARKRESELPVSAIIPDYLHREAVCTGKHNIRSLPAL